MSLVVEFFEIIVPRCANTYGVAPCTASVPTTGDAKCFNCLATCQDTDNFTDDTATLRFAKPADYLKDAGIDNIGGWIRSIDHTSATISLAENRGTRATLSVVIEDNPHSDAGAGLDPYQGERGYDPNKRGSFWPRMCARYPSWQGFECAWYLGEVGESLEEMEKRTFYIESLKPPGRDGSVTIAAKDVMKFQDDDRAQIPRLSEGFLSGSLGTGVTSFTISPSGAGDDGYPASGHICIAGKEVCSFSRTADSFTIVRAQLGTTEAGHSAGDRVQLVKRFVSMAPADILEEAVTDFTDTPAGYVPLSEWQLEDSTNLGTLYTYTLVEPTGVGAFVSRVLEQSGSMMWDDALAKKLRWKVIKPVPTSADVISEANVIGNTFEVADQPEQRYSRAQVYYGISDPTKKRDDRSNYRQTTKQPEDATAQANEALYGSQKIRTIFADGIAVGAGSVADRVANLVVGRKQRTPKRYKWSMSRKEANLPQLGQAGFLSWRSLQDASGALELVPVQIIACKVTATRHEYTAEEMRFTDLDTGSSTDRVLLINFDTNNVDLRALHDLTYPSEFTGVTVTFITSATIGSTSTSSFALRTGTWPITPKLINQGRLQGKGGQGGSATLGIGNNGLPGGPALLVESALDLDNADGEIFGGGGGGGSGGGNVFTDGGAGGGGAGTQPGNGGAGFSPSGPASPGTADAGGAGSSGVPGVGGTGGGPGLVGSNGTAGSLAAGTGGAAGSAIDGVSLVNDVGADPGDIRGPQIN